MNGTRDTLSLVFLKDCRERRSCDKKSGSLRHLAADRYKKASVGKQASVEEDVFWRAFFIWFFWILLMEKSRGLSANSSPRISGVVLLLPTTVKANFAPQAIQLRCNYIGGLTHRPTLFSHFFENSGKAVEIRAHGRSEIMDGKLLISIQEAADRIDISRAKLYQMLSSGRFGPKPIKLGRRTLVSARELEAWVESGCPPRSVWLRRNS